MGSLPKTYRPFFFLKYIHLLIANKNNKTKIYQIFDKFIDNLQIFEKNYTLYYLRFYLIIAKTCQSLLMKETLEKLCLWLLDKFYIINDELLCLETLCIVKDNKTFRNQWNDFLYTSHYQSFCNKFIRDKLKSNNIALEFSIKVDNYLRSENV